MLKLVRDTLANHHRCQTLAIYRRTAQASGRRRAEGCQQIEDPTYWLAAEKDEGKLGVSDVSIGANALALNLPQSGAARLKKPSTVCSISWTRTIHYPKPSMNQWRYTISTSGKYTHKLENISGTLIIHTKTAFVGFLTAIQSVNALFTDFLVGSPDQLPHLEYLRTYELSQDLI